MMENIKRLAETEAVVRQEMEKLRTREERAQMLHQLADYVRYLNDVQARPQLVRERYYEAAGAVFNYLRVNRQLGREAHRFDREVLQELECVLSKLLVDYGSR